jgi:MmgE/PrpD N-terminal domain
MAGLYPGHPFECRLNAAPPGLAGVFRFPVRRKLRPGSRASRANRTAKPMLAAEVPLGTPRLFHRLTTRALSPAPLSVVSPAVKRSAPSESGLQAGYAPLITAGGHNLLMIWPRNRQVSAVRSQALNNTLCIAWSLAGGLLEFARGDGGMVKRLHLGRASEAGVLAASRAADGFAGPHTVLEGEFGFLNVFCTKWDEAELTRGLGEEFLVSTTC